VNLRKVPNSLGQHRAGVLRYWGVLEEKSPDFRSPEVHISAKCGRELYPGTRPQ